MKISLMCSEKRRTPRLKNIVLIDYQGKLPSSSILSAIERLDHQEFKVEKLESSNPPPKHLSIPLTL